MRLGGTTITVINPIDSNDPTGYDGVGNPIYGDPTLTVVYNCSIQQHRTSREISTTDVIVSRDRLFAPASAPLAGTSIVAIGVVTSWPLAADDPTIWYLADGDPAVWDSSNGIASHIEMYIRRQSG